MKTSRFTDAQMVAAVRSAEVGTQVTEICRSLGVSEATCFRWKRRLGDLGTAGVRERRQLREENRKLKQLVADLSLDKTILQESLKRKW